mgnify:CR=1 FL=1
MQLAKRNSNTKGEKTMKYENDKVVIVTQKYHLTRSIYIARNNNINCYGISSYNYKYVGQLKRDIREILARVKDYIFVKLNISPKYEVA